MKLWSEVELGKAGSAVAVAVGPWQFDIWGKHMAGRDAQFSLTYGRMCYRSSSTHS